VHLRLHLLDCGRSVAKAESDACLRQILRIHFHANGVANKNFDEIFAKFPRNVSEHDVLVWQFDAEHGSGENCDDFSF